MSNKAKKTIVPQIFHKILPRKQIIKAMDDASLSKAVYMVAPYGFGKTLAALSWLRRYNRQTAWITLDETDNSESAFINLISAVFLPFAVNQINRDFFFDIQVAEHTQTFLTDTAALIAEDGISIDTLIIDNFHYIKDDGLLRSIKSFIHILLGHIRVIIMSRAELSPLFNDLVLKGHICLVTAKELSFSIEEIAEYFDMNRCPAPHKNLMQIHNATEGWPAAINVILMTSHDVPIEYGEDSRTYVKSFFETEIWNDLDKNVKDFLLRTSVLDKLTPSSCYAITGVGATLPILGWLFTNGLFISKLEKNTYCYHRVFNEYLLDKLEASDIDEESLYKKYAWWLYERNEIAQSFSYFFKACDLYGVRQTLKKINPTDMGIDGFLELVGCITELYVTELRPYPEIVARMALVHYLRGEVSKMQTLTQVLLEWLEPGQLPISAEEYAEYRWEVGWLCYLDPDRDANDPRHLEHSNYRYYVPHLKELHISRFAMFSFPSYFRGIRDYGNEYIFSFDQFFDRVEGGEKHLIDEEEVLWTTYLISAEYEYELEHFSKAEKIVRRVMPLVEDRRYTYLYLICTALLVKLARAVGNPGEIVALTARLETIIMNNGHHYILPNFHAFKLRNRLMDGQAGVTDDFMEENGNYADKPYIYLLYRHITLVRGLLSTGGFSEAMIILGNLEMMCQRYNRPTDLIEVNVLVSIALYGLTQEEEACRHLIKALKSAKTYGYIRIFSDDAKDIWPVLELVRKQINDKYTQNVTISCKKAFTRAKNRVPTSRYSNAELTRAELNMLKSLQAGMSYKEIALDSHIQISTVKSHAHSVYSKLKVSNRTAAVVEAKRLGIL